MRSLLKKSKVSNRKYAFHALTLIILFSILVYPPSVSISRSQKVKNIPITTKVIHISKNDSLIERVRITDSLLKEKCKILKQQQKTLTNLTIKNK